MHVACRYADTFTVVRLHQAYMGVIRAPCSMTRTADCFDKLFAAMIRSILRLKISSECQGQ